ncbi:hypothetical protein D3C77_738370 [compost metagenome]
MQIITLVQVVFCCTVHPVDAVFGIFAVPSDKIGIAYMSWEYRFGKKDMLSHLAPRINTIFLYWIAK